MALYLVQHGLSLSKAEDPERGLSEAGIADTKRVAEVAAGYQVQTLKIHHSPKKRARQTAEIMAGALQPADGMSEKDGLLPLDDVEKIAPTLAAVDELMLVGHLPFMEKLTSLLVTGDPEQRIFKFQNSGIVCLDREGNDPFWFIKWTLMPNIG